MIKNHYFKFKKQSPILLTAEHASKRIPQKYKNLGLSRKELNGAKDLYDPGTKEILQIMQKNLHCSYIYSNLSRLVIDYNRRYNTTHKFSNSFHAAALKGHLLTEINNEEILIPIPKNTFKNKKEFLKQEKERYDKYVWPYRHDAEKIIKNLLKIHNKIIIISIHSFYPVYNKNKRKVDIGILYDHSPNLAQKFLKILQKNSNLNIQANQPWKMSDADGGIFHKEDKKENIEFFVIEINSKHLRSDKNIKKIAKLLNQSMSKLLKLTGGKRA